MSKGPRKPNPISLWLERRRFRRSITPGKQRRGRRPRRPGPIARMQGHRDRRRQRLNLRKSSRLGPFARFRARREVRRQAPPKVEGPTIRERIEARTSRDKGPPPPKRRAPLFGGRGDRVFAGIVGVLVVAGGVAFVLTRGPSPGVQTGFQVQEETTVSFSPSPTLSRSPTPSRSPSRSPSPSATSPVTTAAQPPVTTTVAPPPVTTTTTKTTTKPPTTTTKPPTTTTKPPTTNTSSGPCTIPIQCTGSAPEAGPAITAGPSDNAIALVVVLLALLVGASIAARGRYPTG